MKVAEYDLFVRRTDQYAGKSPQERHAVAVYGLVGEIGSLISAVKKKILAEDGRIAWDQPTEEIKEEIGDVLWYCYSLAQIANNGSFDILAFDIKVLNHEIGGENERAQNIKAALDPVQRDAFLKAAESFPPSSDYFFDDYQNLALKTARTSGRILIEVCLTVLSQLGAELLHAMLPAIEKKLNTNITNRQTNIILGEITWHLAAIASLYDLSLDEVVAFNKKKVGFRAERGIPTPLHDEGRQPKEQFPRQFDIAFVRVAPGKSRMYFQGRRLGDDLTDNALEDDGYRFHDVLHLGLIAHLGWSPVVRGMMKRKRPPEIDEVQDGGRAKVVEELVLKAIHSEGAKQANESGRCAVQGATRLFPEPSTITFRLLKTLRTYVEGLEVWKNAYWEWEDAICDGCNVFFQLRTHGQGTVHVDLENRRLTFVPTVAPGISGNVVQIGSGTAGPDADVAADVLSIVEREWATSTGLLAQTLAAKRALFEALGFDSTRSPPWDELQLRLLNRAKVSMKASGAVQERIWDIQAVDYKVAFTTVADQILCTIAVIAEPSI